MGTRWHVNYVAKEPTDEAVVTRGGIEAGDGGAAAVTWSATCNHKSGDNFKSASRSNPNERSTRWIVATRCFTARPGDKRMITPEYRTVKVLDLLLHRENPRHAPKESQEDAITYLLQNEEVYNLARHMAKYGINPLEVVAVFPDEDGNLIAAEGNRRLCAAQLLTDPEKAPDPAARTRFRSLAAKAVDVSDVNVAVFTDYDTAQPWLQVLHDGEQDGVGRRRWKPEQKARATTNLSTNSLAVALLDHAVGLGLLAETDRASVRVSTVTRYLQNPRVRSALGLASTATSETIELIGGDTGRFNAALKDFLTQVRDGRLHSRSKTADWNRYAEEVEQNFGPAPVGPVSKPVKETEAAAEARVSPARSSRARIIQPNVSTIGRSTAVVQALNELGSPKLTGLYTSLTTLRLDEHPALLTTGAWAFIEVLTAIHGRNPGSDFVAYLNGLSGRLGFDKDRWKDCRLSLEEIQHRGNAEKHGATFTTLDARNLHNRFHILEPVLEAVIKECVLKNRRTS